MGGRVAAAAARFDSLSSYDLVLAPRSADDAAREYHLVQEKSCQPPEGLAAPVVTVRSPLGRGGLEVCQDRVEHLRRPLQLVHRADRDACPGRERREWATDAHTMCAAAALEVRDRSRQVDEQKVRLRLGVLEALVVKVLPRDR